MKKILALATIIVFTFISCSENSLEFSVKNNSDFDRLEEVLEISLSKLNNALELAEGEAYTICDDKNSVLPSQSTYDNKLIFQPKLKAGETKTFKVISAPKQEFASKVYSNHFPERYGDLAWENDRVGFRFYGEPLKAVQAPSNGLDLWYKRTNDLVLDKWYKKDISGEASYHADHGEGCDPYSVGRTLGGGSMSPYIDNKLMLNENFISHQILENGPLRTTFKLVYPSLTINNKELIETKTITLDVGSQLTRISQEYSTDDQRDHFSVAAGFAKHAEGDSLIYRKGKNYMIYQEPFSEENGQVYLGLIITQGIEKVFVDSYNYTNQQTGHTDKLANTLASMTYMPGAPAIYYTGFGWNKFGFESIDKFEEYVSRFSQSLTQPLVVTYNEK